MNSFHSSRQVASFLRLAALAAVLPLAACQSPMATDPADKNLSLYANSIIARSLADGSFRDMPLNTPTRVDGIRELPRIDSPGTGPVIPAGAKAVAAASPMTFNTPATLPNTLPATNRSDLSNRPGPTTQVSLAPSQLLQTEKIYSISLQEAIQRALRHNLDIKVEAFNPAIRETKITQALAVFDPSIIGSSAFTNTDRPPVDQTSNGVRWENTIGLKKLTPSGATITTGIGDIYRDFQTPSLGLPKSSHEANINFAVTQPLLRGFGSNVTQANIYLAQKDYQISLAQFRAQVIKSVAQVEEAYQNLSLSTTLVDIQERLLAATMDTYRKIEARQGVDATNVEVAQARASVEARRADLIRAYSAVRNTSDQLKLLMNDPELDIRTNVLVIPADRPIDAPIALNIADQVSTALKYRPELQEARLNISKADIVVDTSKNDLLPKLDLNLGVQTTGQNSGFDDAFAQTVNNTKYVDYIAGLRLEIPLGNRAAEAALRQHKLERSQAVTNMLQAAEKVVGDVKSQLRDLLTSYEEIQARDTSRIYAGIELAALTEREAVERLTPEFSRLKLDAQQALANAEIAQINAIVNYNLAIMRLEQAKGTLLEYNRIAIGPAPDTVTDIGKIRFMGKTYEMGK